MKNKKRWLALGMAVMMAAAAFMTGCGGNGGSSSDSGSTGSAAGDAGSSAAESAGEASDSGKADASGGSVYYLNFKPEQDPQWQDLAKAYTEETGVPVTVFKAASEIGRASCRERV